MVTAAKPRGNMKGIELEGLQLAVAVGTVVVVVVVAEARVVVVDAGYDGIGLGIGNIARNVQVFPPTFCSELLPPRGNSTIQSFPAQPGAAAHL